MLEEWTEHFYKLVNEGEIEEQEEPFLLEENRTNIGESTNDEIKPQGHSASRNLLQVLGQIVRKRLNKHAERFPREVPRFRNNRATSDLIFALITASD